MKPKKMFLGGLFSSKKKDDKPMTMTQKKAEEANKRARGSQMRSESKARRGRTASTTAVGGQRNKQQAPMDAERAANMAMVKKDRPMPKRPSATSLANAATPKPTRPAKPQKEPTTSSVAAPSRTPTRTTNDQKPPASGLAKVTGTEQGKTGGVRRNVGSGREKKANVTREQLQKTGLSLRDYLNFMDKNDRRPTSKADSEAAKKLTAAFKAKKAKKSGVDKVPNKKAPRKNMMRGGMMKSKGYAKGGAMKTKGYNAGGQIKKKSKFPDLNKDGKVTQADILQGRGVVKKKAGGMMKSKGYAKGGAMKTKGYKTGGKVRGAGIARRGVRPAKIR
jgi:hypothetical protein